MTDYEIGDVVRIVSDVFDDHSQRISGSTGVVWRLGQLYVWVTVGGLHYPCEAGEIEKESQA